MENKPNSNEQIGGAPASGGRRTVVVDIETVALDPTTEKGALDALTGRAVCICMLVDDGTAAREPIVSDMQTISAARVEPTIGTEAEEDACLG